ncbi:MAG: TraR/DksA family transcriptional regulator [Gammaproteobacteria bacterium]|nr:MAG: TraR/DksA family transcriptional regulator [Gammaproteobacteria bacterium]
MDEIDLAQEAEARFTRQALARHKAQAQAETPLVEGGARVCRDCHEVIPWARLRIDPRIVRCVDCQEAYERRR